jgi:hypothetical protein
MSSYEVTSEREAASSSGISTSAIGARQRNIMSSQANYPIDWTHRLSASEFACVPPWKSYNPGIV